MCYSSRIRVDAGVSPRRYIWIQCEAGTRLQMYLSSEAATTSRNATCSRGRHSRSGIEQVFQAVIQRITIIALLLVGARRCWKMSGTVPCCSISGTASTGTVGAVSATPLPTPYALDRTSPLFVEKRLSETCLLVGRCKVASRVPVFGVGCIGRFGIIKSLDTKSLIQTRRRSFSKLRHAELHEY